MRFVALFIGLAAALPAYAEEVVAPAAPPIDWMIVQYAIDGKAAYSAAVEAYTAYETAEAAFATAKAAVDEAIAGGAQATSPAEEFGGLLQEAVNARVARDDAKVAYDGAMAILAVATERYTTALPENPVTALEERVAELEASADLAALAARVEALEAADRAVTEWCVVNASTTLCRARAIDRQIGVLQTLLE
jgi:hypothetical protein